MKLLYFKWLAFTRSDIEEAFHRLNIEYDTVSNDDLGIEQDKNLEEKVVTCLASGNHDAVFSINYYYLLAEICHRFSIPYIAWSYDAPVNVGIAKPLFYDTTNLFVMDGHDYDFFRNMGVDHVYHIPLAVNAERYDDIIVSDEEKNQYGGDISFIGQLYNENADKAISHLPDYEKGYLNAAIDSQFRVYGSDIISNALTPELLRALAVPGFLKDISFAIGTENFENIDSIPQSVLWYACLRSVTHRERILLLSLLAKRYKTALFSDDDSSMIQGLDNRGIVNYQFEMPKVFKSTAINLNISLRCIVTGIPQRCLDIMASHAFLLSNYQPELAEYFNEGEEIAMYSSMEEAVDKCDYYLKHPDIRKKIAAMGYKKVKKEFRFEERLREIFDKVKITIMN